MNPSGRVVQFCVAGLLFAVAASAQSTTVNITVNNQVDNSVGLNGRFQLGMSTSFQLASWSYNFFERTPSATTPLDGLAPRHTRVQVVSDGIPLTAAHSWDFTQLNTMLPPIQSTGEHGPELQIGTAPSFLSNSSGQILPSSFQDFAEMGANLVRYYNTGGFDDSGTHYQSPTPYPVTWWGIFNEPDINGLTAQQYTSLYNTTVPLMSQADPSIKFVAVELAGAPSNYFPTFVANVTAPVHAVAKHFYSTCNQRDLDQALFATIPGFAGNVRDMYSAMAVNPALSGVPVWITENNVNADYDNGNGISACNAPSRFVIDTRGTSPFFAAWRSLVFQQLGQAGAQTLYHWGFGTDAQYGEVDPNAKPYLSYWVDYYLSHWLPSPPGQDILKVTTGGCCAADSAHGWQGNGGLQFDTQTMAARNPDSSVVILMSNYALQASHDNNGIGTSRTFALDLSSLGTFDSATLVTLDASTPTAGPVLQSLTPMAHMQVTVYGYGAALLRLATTHPSLPENGVVNAASFTGGPVSPGEIVSLFGTAIGPPTQAGLLLTNPKLVSNTLAGVRVTFDGKPAPITYASKNQVNVVVPYSVNGQASTQVQLEYLGVLTPSVGLPIAAATPGIFTASASGQGAILNAIDNSANSPSNPAAQGDWVSIYTTGTGITTPASVDGMLGAPPLPQPNAKVTVLIAGARCKTNYVGAAPGLIAGVTQINAQVPLGITPGPSVPVQIVVGNISSQTVNMAVR